MHRRSTETCYTYITAVLCSGSGGGSLRCHKKITRAFVFSHRLFDQATNFAPRRPNNNTTHWPMPFGPARPSHRLDPTQTYIEGGRSGIRQIVHTRPTGTRNAARISADGPPSSPTELVPRPRGLARSSEILYSPGRRSSPRTESSTAKPEKRNPYRTVSGGRWRHDQVSRSRPVPPLDPGAMHVRVNFWLSGGSFSCAFSPFSSTHLRDPGVHC